jgi:hypothetical protein
MRRISRLSAALGISGYLSVALVHPAANADIVDAKAVGDQVWITGHRCETLQKQAQALIEWKKLQGYLAPSSSAARGQKTECQPYASTQPAQPADPSYSVQLNVTEILRGTPLESLNQCPKVMGANCWNFALASAGLAQGLRYTSAEEISALLESPLCSPVRTGKPQTGDLVVMRDQSKIEGGHDQAHDNLMGELHAYVYLTPQLGLTKNGYRHSQPYTVMGHDNLHQAYGLAPEECRLTSTPTPKGCKTWSTVYRCISLQEYQRRHPPPARLTALDNELGRAECLLQRITQQAALDGSQLDLLQSVLESAIQALKEDALSAAGDSDTRVLNYLFESRAHALLLQIKLIRSQRTS